MMTMMMTTMMMTMMMIDDDALKAASIEEEDPINKEKLEEVDAAMAEQLEKDTKYKKLHADVVAQKLKLVSQKVAVQNGKVHPLFLEQIIPKDIDDPSTLTSTKTNPRNIGLLDVDVVFNNALAQAKFSYAELFIQLWPGNAVEQLHKLNTE